MREIDLEPSAGEPPVRVYDTSGPYSDPAIEIDINRGLPELRKPWILARGDVEFYEGREVKPEDNGLRRGEPSAVSLFDRGRRQVLRAKAGRGGDPDRLCPARHRHAGDGICRDPREPRPREIAARRGAWTANRSAPRSPTT